MAKRNSKSSKQLSADPPPKRTYLKQSDVPAASLDEALRVSQAILDHYAGKPTAPLYVAKALNVDPKGSQLKETLKKTCFSRHPGWVAVR
jgi:hypothetical protein